MGRGPPDARLREPPRGPVLTGRCAFAVNRMVEHCTGYDVMEILGKNWCVPAPGGDPGAARASGQGSAR